MKLSTIAVIGAGLFQLACSSPLHGNGLAQNQVQLGSVPANTGDDIEGLTDFKVGDFSLLDLHKSLISHKSISEFEVGVAYFLKRYLQDAGLTVELQPVPSQFHGNKRYNVYAYLGTTRDTEILLTSHIDTVPPFFDYRVEGSRIYGRGSTDAKASVATQILTFLSLVQKGEVKEGDVSLLFVVGEEKDGSGMDHAHEALNATWNTAIFGEPTENKLGVGHKGVLHLHLEVEGKAAHSGYPELGISATEILIPVLNKFLNIEWPASHLLGPSTVNIGQVNAGVATNVIPAAGEAFLLIRVAADLEEIERLIKEATEDIEHLTATIQGAVPAQYLDYEVPGFETIILAYGTDVPHLARSFKRRHLYGPGTIFVAHGANEYVENQDLLDAIDGYTKLIQFNLEK